MIVPSNNVAVKANMIRVRNPPAFKELVAPHRYKSYWGGRGGSKSWAFARILVSIATQRKLRILCTRELQSSIKESVHRLLSDQIELLGLSHLYTIQRDSITSNIGSEFLFKGLRFNIQEIKSLEGVNICWVEEAQSVSEDSWTILIPTIRKEGSEIWLSWNTGEEKDPTYKRFVENLPKPGEEEFDDYISKKVSWRDNPYFPITLERERKYLERVDPDAYLHVWEGFPLKMSEAVIFRNKYIIEEFETPWDAQLLYGADWGFSQDPTVLIRSYVRQLDFGGDTLENHLYIDYEAYGVGVELDEIPALFDLVPGSRDHTIKADNSRPDTISYIHRKGFAIVGGLKWPSGPGKKGSIVEGIEYLRKFTKIHIHQRCKHMAQEAQLYCFKTDKNGEVLNIIIDKHNHCWDSIRYAHDTKIKGGTDWTTFLGED